ncbi:P-loop containing nucleoside triphosphate hydrolase protein [Lipomyces doorenjongii]
MSVAVTEDMYKYFKADMKRVSFYHGQLQAEIKAETFEKWIKGEFALLFCTSGFGVGIDYGSVTLVIHYDGIWNLLDFVQESGRAGRNNAPARSLVLLRTNWNPNSNRMVAGEAQAVVEYVNPAAYCRRLMMAEEKFSVI